MKTTQRPKKDERLTAREALEKESAYARMLANAKAVVLHGKPPKKRIRGDGEEGRTV